MSALNRSSLISLTYFCALMTIKTFFVFLFLLSFSACTTVEDCITVASRAYINISFISEEAVKFDSITLNQSGRFEGDTSTLTFFSPFLSQELDVYRLDFYTDSVDYSVAFIYDTQIQIFDIDCDPVLAISNLDTISTTFDSLAIIHTELLFQNTQGDVQIYL
ncbi:MAG: hypothetical protein ACJASO_002895 [Cyclobacteriaceae bacterium]|jgi:hypothetical protein